ncbi:MAG: isoaspartyl peptidase/L-asparaginase family protein, partial [Candidatus Kapaibacteriota bacterium]
MNAKSLKIIILLFYCISYLNVYPQKPYAIIVHGGAGTYSTDSSENHEIKKVLLSAVEMGYSILESGGSAIDAVESAIKILENSFIFNAGRGSVLNEEGFVEMDASIMEGSNLQAGAVAGVRDFPNPISLARLVMEKTPHVLFAGEGIDKLIKKFKLTKISPDSFKLQPKHKERKKSAKEKHGTVGAVAIDMYGNISAGTSTGGVLNKMVGRVGDSPIIGAGTYAKNSTCGVSCTGLGEFFIRQSAAFQV